MFIERGFNNFPHNNFKDTPWIQCDVWVRKNYFF